MNRFFGMMPRSEIELIGKFKTDLGIIVVEAGKNGWTISKSLFLLKNGLV